MATSNNENTEKMREKVKYVPFQSSIDASFWLKASSHKLHNMRLNEGPVAIVANFARKPPASRADEIEVKKEEKRSFFPPRMRLDQNSLVSDDSREDEAFQVENETIKCTGSLYVFNTLEAFKRVNKKDLLNQHARKIQSLLHVRCDDVQRNQDSSSKTVSFKALHSILLVSFLDLKKHKAVYWCAFPALATIPGTSIFYSSFSFMPSFTMVENNHLSHDNGMKHSRFLSSILSKDRNDELVLAFHSMRISLLRKQQTLPPYFFIKDLFSKNKIQCIPLDSYVNIQNDKFDYILAFLDPSDDPDHPGWPLRNLLAYLSLSSVYQHLQEKTIPIISFRPSTLRRLPLDILSDENASNASYNALILEHRSILFCVRIPLASHYDWKKDSPQKQYELDLQLLGWEKNPQNKLSPRVLSLASLLSPSHLTNTAVNLNLSLLKWRQIPDLNTNLLSRTKCLLLGAGTLGCNVARILLGWGIQDITFVDNGKVTYSNPARQNLFTIKNVHEDKAPVAAMALKDIVPGVRSRGFTLNIPMPGHDLKGEKDWQDYRKLRELIRESDVVFLLTDTRESRWLPTLLAKFENKTLINSALGLDTYLVMRHGRRMKSDTNAYSLGCYFCNDVVAPENSTRERTLDQQCTVTRPGLAPIAGALAVEMMVALLHHENDKQHQKKKMESEGETISFNRTTLKDTSALGDVPHQIRGSLSSHTLMTPNVPSFPHCTACSDAVLNCFDEIGDDLLKKVCSSNQMNNEGVEFLETLTGLKDFRKKAEDVELDWDDDMSSDGDEDI